MFKRKISKKDFLEELLIYRYNLEETLIKKIYENFNYNGNKKELIYEIRIFTLWMLTISLPHSFKNDFKDDLHNKFCKNLELDEEIKQMFLEDLDQRYKNYFSAFNTWMANPNAGHILGSVIVENIKNQNPNFSLETQNPQVGATESFRAFALFSEFLKSTIEMVKDINSNYKITE